MIFYQDILSVANKINISILIGNIFNAKVLLYILLNSILFFLILFYYFCVVFNCCGYLCLIICSMKEN